MSLGLIGKKLGMTQVYNEKGDAVSVTVVSVQGNAIVQVKQTAGKDGYSAVQVGFDEQKEKRLNKPLQGHFKKAGVGAKKLLREFRLESDEQLPAADQALGADLFVNGQFVDVIGTTRGKDGELAEGEGTMVLLLDLSALAVSRPIDMAA
jgi:large subunit ribosomal protein L3